MKKLLALLCAMAILCSVCVPVLAAEEKVPVVAQVPEGWEIAYLYAWGDQGEIARWPGIPMTAQDGYFYAYMPSTMNNVIINSGSGIQTADLAVKPGVPVYVQAWDIYDAHVGYDLPIQVPGEQEVPKVTVTIHAGVPEGWTGAYLYAWNDNGANYGWPGVPMTKGDDGFWTAELLPAYTNVVIAEKDGGAQSVDLTVTGNECWIAFTTQNENGKFEANVSDAAPEDFVPPGAGEDPVEPEVPVADMVVYVKLPDQWTNPRLWIWDENGNTPAYIGVWPGNLAMTLEADGWYSCAIPSKYNNFLISADGELQTGDMMVSPAPQVWVDCYDPGLISIYYENPNGQAPGPMPIPTVMVHAGVPESWTGCYLYAWNETGPYTEWPGIEMSKFDDGFWAADVPAEYNNVVIAQKNGNVQSVDLTVEGSECWIAFIRLNDSGKYEANVTDYAPENFVPPVVPETPVEPSEEMTVYAKVPTEWINVRLWAWDDENTHPEDMGPWPGNLTMTRGEDGWYYYSLPMKYRNLLINGDGVQTKDLKVEQLPEVWLDCTDPQNPVVSYSKPGSAVGAALSGKITSFGDASEMVTVQLWQEDAVYTVTTTEGTYTFENVAFGSYTLKVSKAKHVTRAYAVVVEADAQLDVKIHLLGDVTGDGRVNVADTSKVYSHVKGSALLTDYALACADVDGNGKINVADTSKVYSHVKGSKLLW